MDQPSDPVPDASTAPGDDAPIRRQRRVPKLVVALGVLAFLASVLVVAGSGGLPPGATLRFQDQSATTFRIPPGDYLLVADPTLREKVTPSPDTLPVYTCSGTEADGTPITVTPHFRYVPDGILSLNGFMGAYRYPYQFARVRFTQANPTLACEGPEIDIAGVTLAPVASFELLTVARPVATALALAGAAFLVAWPLTRLIGRPARRTVSRAGLGLVGLAVATALTYVFLPTVQVRAMASVVAMGPPLTATPCSLEHPQVVTGDSVTGLSFDRAYLLDNMGVAICLTVQPFTPRLGSPIVAGTPMVLTMTSQYVHQPRPTGVVNPSGYGGYSLQATATSGGQPVPTFSDFSDYLRVGVLTSLLLPTFPDTSPDVQLFGYGAADPASLDLTLTLRPANATTRSLAAQFSLD